ncbi:MAG: hypoxanthine phosphoribosyltransferase [Armatimonadetes bacterium]|nr:hypoxanthine phosphoribosyltransferase [Armatimonadota bacterium]
MRVETVLTEEQIASRTRELAQQIQRAYAESRPLLLSVLKGSVFFLADLARELGSGYPIDFMAVASYDGTRSTRAVEIRLDVSTHIEGRDVLIVEDIVDSGLTLEYLLGVLKARGATSVRVVTLLFKSDAFQGRDRPDFIGFELPNEFVVGYGMDLNEEWRNLKFVGRLVP